MSKLILSPLLAILLIVLIVILLITIKFYQDQNTAKKLWTEAKFTKMQNIGEVASLNIIPLIDYYAVNDKLAVESGVAYLLETEQKRILFDVGFNRENLHPSPLLKNMQELDINPANLDFIVISHLHVDHVGGLQAKKNSTFALSGEEVDLKGLKAYTPTRMVHKSAEIEVVSGPTKIAEGIVSLGPINRAIWGMGLTAEQALAINVKDKGIVLIVGCGHQTIEKVVEQANQVFDVPIYAIYGGLHFPVTSREGDFVFNIRKILGTGTLPWQGISREDVSAAINFLTTLNLSKIGISAHDSCDWTIVQFKEAFQERYNEILVGKRIVIE